MSFNLLARQFQRMSSGSIFHHGKQLLIPVVPAVSHFHVGGIYEPDYLETGKSKIPLYNPLNIQLKGYDFPVLENFQKFVHKVARNMEIEVEDGWALPPQYLQVQRLKPQSTVLEAEYKLTIYERNIQVVDLPSTIGSIFFEVLQTALPEGVNMTIHEHNEEFEEMRYVPDAELLDLKTQLEELRSPSKKK